MKKQLILTSETLDRHLSSFKQSNFKHARMYSEFNQRFELLSKSVQTMVSHNQVSKRHRGQPTISLD